MKKLYYSSCSFATPHMGVLLDSMIEDNQRGTEIHWAYCAGVLDSCFMNYQGKGITCRLCQLEYREMIREYAKGISVHPISKGGFTKHPNWQYESVDDLKRIVYRDVYVGYSVLSLYITLKRDVQFSITDSIRKSFDKIIDHVCSLIDCAYELIEQINPNVIAIYNGRYYESRAFYDIAMKKEIAFEAYEVVGGIAEPYYKVCYKGGLPHDTRLFARNVDRIWKLSSDINKEQIGKAFFEKRRKGIPAADKVYITKQQAGLLPANIDLNRRNIVIFNSSDDELAALGGEWEQDKLFKSQYDAIDYILSHCSKDIHFYLRIHPNLCDVHSSFVTDLYELGDKYVNLTVIAPNNPISTYALMDIAEKVVVFGSTTGVEACYWAKPVVLIGHSFYVHLDIAYHPNTHNDIVRMIESADLKPKPQLDAIKYAYYILDRKYRIEPTNYIQINPQTIHLFGRAMKVFPFLKLKQSVAYFKILSLLVNYFIAPFSKKKYNW